MANATGMSRNTVINGAKAFDAKEHRRGGYVMGSRRGRPAPACPIVSPPAHSDGCLPGPGEGRPLSLWWLIRVTLGVEASDVSRPSGRRAKR